MIGELGAPNRSPKQLRSHHLSTADAVVHPRAVVVHPAYAAAADRAVVAARRLER
eukprot:SAG31_NODE_3578_length_4103_cov_1.960789_9_plen_54_part_01